ncbi:MAG TPA: aminoglycoside phosphotransferase family protein [Iamia sp.]|nr:aminoglycoside phosphotransferase family protein [Iamia sp.]
MRFDGRARGWVEAVTGRAVVRARRMPGGVSSAVHEVGLAGGGRLVLRRTIDLPGIEPPTARAEAEREVDGLRRLAGWPLAPTLVAADLDGERCGAPAVLVTRLPGRPWVAPGAAVGAWVDGLAAALRAVHELDPAPTGLPATRPWIFGPRAAPSWTAVPEAWTWAFSVVADGLPAGGPDRLLHRDLHPGNVLFSRRRLTGVVDWESLCRGPAELDLARSRVQVAVLAGLDAADALWARCADLAPAYGPAWDALVACELSLWTEDLLAFTRLGATLTLPGIRATLDEVVTRAHAA